MAKILTHKLIVSLAVMGLFTACTKKIDSGAVSPEKTLTAYVQVFFAMEAPADRLKLNDFLTGESLKRTAEWSEADFHQQVVENKKKFSKLKILDQKLFGEDQANLTYEIEYVEAKTGAKVLQKKLALMKKEGDQWKIRDARNLSQLIEFPETEVMP